ncbi:MAG TPA: DinB family protein [Gemmatimonadaceae bacterium]|nr:DinB family protein [Gemmatimonadaceae bacterium]
MTDAFIERSRYYLVREYPTKIRLAIEAMPAGAIWSRPKDTSNSVGNLIVHLAGNVREWIVAGIGGEPNVRDRQSEFARSDGPGSKELLAELQCSVTDADRVLERLDARDLCRECTIQGRKTTIMSAVYHVVEHFAMHTGQIILLAKLHAPGAIRFYDDSSGLAVPLWGGAEGMEPDTTDVREPTGRNN